MNIKILDKQTIAQIAAGEVVERPASVVKELVENSLDAGSSQISVEIRVGGIGFIRVTDNGAGIIADQVVIAFERHATSKITNADDLQNINTLGFRGEALPSIAAVARVEIITRAQTEPAATLARIEAGKIVEQKSQSRTQGTTLTVKDLFQNVPARLKFLKSVATETSHVADVVSHYALAYPGVRFTLSVDGKETLRTTGQGRLLDTIVDIYSVPVANKMLPVSGASEAWKESPEASQIRVSGMVSQPEVSRAGRGSLNFFVNNRWVNSRLLARAVEEAYHGLLMVGRHPVAIINLALPPAEIDVNIHPAKSEVKFRDERSVFRAVQRAVRQALVAQIPAPEIEEPGVTFANPNVCGIDLWVQTGSDIRRAPPEEDAKPQPLMMVLPILRVLGQVMNNYIVAEGPEGLYLIDQHAAHERIRFEMLQGQRAREEVEVQGLLDPATIDVTPAQAAVLKSCLEELEKFGFAMEAFGERTYLLRTVPALATGDDWKGMLGDLLDSLSGEAKANWQEKILISVACHGAIKAGQSLSAEEMREMVRQLEQTLNPYTCPHGRPTMIHLNSKQLEKEFGRI